MGIKSDSIILKGVDLWKEYPSGKNSTLRVLQGINIDIQRGDIVIIVGPSGAGKSTLLHLLGGLERPTKGNVLFDSEDIFTFNEEKLANFRNNTLGFVFQFHHLLPEFTALENVMMPALIKGQSLKNCRSKAKEILIEVGLEGRLNHKPAELSGGEQQRVAVGRSLMNNPQLVLADEPSGNLDETNGKILHELLIQLSERRGVTFVIATHNPDLAARAKTKIHLVDGQIVSD